MQIPCNLNLHGFGTFTQNLNEFKQKLHRQYRAVFPGVTATSAVFSFGIWSYEVLKQLYIQQ